MQSTAQINGTLSYEISTIGQLAKAILYFAKNSSSKLYKTKLNKLLFYSQFLHQKEFGNPFIENITFIKDYYGPVLERLDYTLDVLNDVKLISIETNEFGEVITPLVNLEGDLYSFEEDYVLKKVLKAFDSFSAHQLSNYSHKEKLWIDTELKKPIPLERAHELNGI